MDSRVIGIRTNTDSRVKDGFSCNRDKDKNIRTKNGRLTVTRYSHIFYYTRTGAKCQIKYENGPGKIDKLQVFHISEKSRKIRSISILAGLTHKQRAVTTSRLKLACNAGHES